MPKGPQYHPAQRVDLPDFLFTADEHPRDILTRFAKSSLGFGVMDGFQIKVPDQSSTQIGRIEIFNGFAYDGQGRMVTAVEGTNSQQITLGGSNQEFWIEVELFFFNSDPDQRAFWDPNVDQSPPLPTGFPDGEEINIARTYTRKSLFWRIKQPIRQNGIGLRNDPGYTPARFNDNDSLTVRLAVLRTNGSGQILGGDPNVDSSGNDLVSVTTAAGTARYVKLAGYGETKYFAPGNVPIIYGRKMSDQRIRIWEPQVPPMLYGASGEVQGDSVSDGWIRDIKSMYDHLATAISEIKHGSGGHNLGHTVQGSLNTLDPDYQYVDLQAMLTNDATPVAYSASTDDFMGCTFQIKSGNWSGFYAYISGNDETTGGGITRVYLGKTSHIPKWKEFPVGNPSVQIIQNRQVNWLGKPTPDSNNRGLNALDTEVVQGRVDSHTGLTFGTLKNRLDGGKYAALTISPLDTVNATTGSPDNVEAADSFSSIVDMDTSIQIIAGLRAGGIVLFRKGDHTYNSLIATAAPLLGPSSVFELSNAKSMIFQGEGASNTILRYGDLDDLNGDHNIFNLSDCSDIEFRDMTFRGKGTIFTCYNCSNIRFVNCKFEGLYWNDPSGANLGLTKPTLDLQTATKFLFDNCVVETSGGGVFATTFQESEIRGGIFKGTDVIKLNNNYILNLGAITKSKISTHIEGYVNASGLNCTGVFDSTITETRFLVTADANEGVFNVAGNCVDSVIANCVWGPVPSIGGIFSIRLFQVVKFLRSKFTGNSGENASICAFDMSQVESFLNGPENSVISGNTVQGSGSLPATAIRISGGKQTVCSNNVLVDVGYGISMEDCVSVVVDGNQVTGCSRGVTSEDNTTTVSPVPGAGAGGVWCSVTNNNIVDPTNAGIKLLGFVRCHMSGNQVKGSPSNPYSLTGSSYIRGGHGVASAGVPATWTEADLNNNEIYAYNTHLGS